MEKDTTERKNTSEIGRIQLPDDDHKSWEWKTKYNGDAMKYIRREAIYLGVLLFVSLFCLCLLYTGHIYSWYCLIRVELGRPPANFYQEMYCLFSGALGGVVYGIKILYKAVASGKWHMDRALWRIFSPWMSIALTVVIGSFMSVRMLSNNFSAVCLGFFIGYFSESAIGKLYSIAAVLFG